MFPSAASAAPIISNGGNVIRRSSLTSRPRIFIHDNSIGSDSGHLCTHRSQVVQAMKLSTIAWLHSCRPSMNSRSQNHLPRGDWLSQPRP